MKFNKWTLGLAALGVVSLASAVRAEEAAAKIFTETAVSGTQISGYVNTSAHWNFNGYRNTLDSFGGNKADGFNLDAVSVTISKPLDETDWAAGYNFQMVYGQDAALVGMNDFSSDKSTIKNAYVELRAPVGNGIDLKVGVWDTILGYEGFDRGNNPNYTYSYGYLLEPTTYAGVLASYKVCDVLSVQGGVADVANGGGGVSPASRASIDSRKTYLGSLALTAPQSWGVLAGSTLYAGATYGATASTTGTLTGGPTGEQANYYVGTVVNTGVKGLKVGASYDHVSVNNLNAGGANGWVNAMALYSSFQATDKLSLHARAEYAWGNGIALANIAGAPLGSVPAESAYAFTGTVQYDLWKNVLSRVELRWDHTKDGLQTSSGAKDAIMLAGNLIYKF